ncbi:hypothetical protein EK599_08680 [Vibrio sp. T187]|uniref:hypothetical protein n=1 Tax=Vibrio TaxID=662 RepID=UPI0010C97E50|nr:MULTISPECIES: hypothetical protein [Vibrio]MBW3695768.1 hypothetical protein [Vibrio sp. T187]
MRNFLDFLDSYGFSHSLPLEEAPSFSDTQFNYACASYSLTEQSKTLVKQYLATEPLCIEDFGKLDDLDAVIAFSFGDSSLVNIRLADTLRNIHHLAPDLSLFAQQEIAQHIADIDHISIDSQQYQTTADVAETVVDIISGNKVLVVAQSWHAARCIQTCEELGLNVRALRSINEFPIDDPQPWVRNPINWVIKESHRKIATGQKISRMYDLC